MKFPESKLAHRYIWPLVDRGFRGCEIGGSAHNWWGEKIRRATINVDYTAEFTAHSQQQIDFCGEVLPVDVVAEADNLPFPDGCTPWIIHSHVIEHVANPIRAHREWWRVLVDGGIVFAHIPHRDALPTDVGRELTTLQHLFDDYANGITESTHPFGCPGEAECARGHYHVWDIPAYLEMVNVLPVTHSLGEPLVRFDVVDARERDEKAGNSFVIVLKAVK